MATKTIVCPECQAPAVPGRYACARCGALLASVALTARAPEGSVSEPRPGLQPTAALEDQTSGEAMADDRPRAAPIAPAWTHALAAEPDDEPLAEPRDDERWDDEAVLVDTVADREMPALRPEAAPADGPARATAPAATRVEELAVAATAPQAVTRAVAPVAKAKSRSSARAPRAQRSPDPAAIDRIAPIAASEPVAEPEPAPGLEPEAQPEPAPQSQRVRDTTPPPDALAAAASVVAPVEPRPVANPRWALPAPEWPATPIDERLTLAGVAAPAGSQPARLEPNESRPGWPPPGDPGVLVEPFARVPAGSYLPPSAVLPPGEAAAQAVAHGRPDLQNAIPPAGGVPTESTRVSAAERLAQLGLPADTPRRVVGIGAVVAALGFLLPWAAVLAGSGLLGDYWTQWGMAGPGHWIVVALLVGLAMLSLVDDRLATVSVGLPAIAIAMLLVGLSWPYLFGFLGKAAGIWVVLFGAILLAAGGLLDLRAGRHDESKPTV